MRHRWRVDSGVSSTTAMDSLNQMTQAAFHQPDKSMERHAAKWPTKWCHVKWNGNRWNTCKHRKQLVVSETRIQKIFSLYLPLKLGLPENTLFNWGKWPPLCLAWIPETEPELRLRFGFRSDSPTTGSGQHLQEFEDSLMAFLGKKTESAAMEYILFRSSWKLDPDSDGSNVNDWVPNLPFAVKWQWRKLLKDKG